MTRLSKELLGEMYIKRNLTSEEIGKLLGCSDTKVLYWIRKCNIPVKPSAPRKKYNLSESLLKQLYTYEKLSCSKIAEKLGIHSETI